MALQYEVDVARGIVRVILSGDADLQSDFEGGVAPFVHHPDFRPGMPSLWDATRLRTTEVSGEFLRKLASRNQEVADLRGRARAAIVTSTDLHYGLSRIYQAYTDFPHLEVAVFRNVQEAEAWLLDSGGPPPDED